VTDLPSIEKPPPRHRLRHLRVLVARDLRVLIRDPTTLVMVLVAPAVAALVASAGLGSPPKIDATVVVVAPPGATYAAALSGLTPSRSPATTSPLRFERAATADDARRAVESGHAVAALILPAAGATGEPIRVLANRNVSLVGDLITSAARTLEARRRVAAGTNAVASYATTGVGRRPLDPGEIYGPVIAVFFLFLAAGFVTRGLVSEREQGTFGRLRTIRISTSMIVAGKSLTMLAVSLVEFSVVLATMTLVYGARWGNPLEVGATTLALALAIAAVAVMISSISNTYQSSTALVEFVALFFAVLGGSLVPLKNLPSVMQVIAGVTPNGIAIASFHNISANAAGITDLVRPILTILVFAAVVGGIGLVRLRRTVEG